MHTDEVQRAAVEELRHDATLSAVSRTTGISRAALRNWRDGKVTSRGADCPRCRSEPGPPEPTDGYAYLLGRYLADGTISNGPRDVRVLRIACADAWPGVMVECVAAIKSIRPHNTVSLLHRQGCTIVTARWKHWICLFPQHGPGKKHTRPIVLAPWQQEIVDTHPGPFLRGLFHSDGCRITNWTTRQVRGERKRYEYPRYFFSNESTDILGLCAAALDRLGVAHRRSRPNTISVARREAVAVLDTVVGPKA